MDYVVFAGKDHIDLIRPLALIVVKESQLGLKIDLMNMPKMESVVSAVTKKWSQKGIVAIAAGSDKTTPILKRKRKDAL